MTTKEQGSSPRVRGVLGVAVSAWSGFVVLSLLDHWAFGVAFGHGEAVAVLYAAALGGGLLAAALGLLLWLLSPLGAWALRHWPTLLPRLELGLLAATWTEALWCLADYLRDPRLPVFHPHPTIYALGCLPSMLVGWLVFRRVRRAPSLSMLLMARLSLLLLAYFGLRWIQGFSIAAFQLPLGLVIFLVLGALSWLWARSERARLPYLLLCVPLLGGAALGVWRLSGSYWARDAALRGGRLSFVAFQLARPFLVGERNGLLALAAQAPAPTLVPTAQINPLKEQLIKTKPKRLLLITVDALRADLGGGATSAPAIARLKREGINFPRHRAGAPGTIESLRTLFLGAYPWMKIESTDFFQLARAGGFYTLAVLPNSYILNLDSGWLRRGFDMLAYDLPYPIPTAPVAMPMTDLLLERLAEIGDKPFVAWVHYNDPHKPYDAAGDTDLERYVGEVQSNDQALEKLLDALDARGLLADTLVVLSADHGEEFGEHGGYTHGLTLYEEILRVPMIIRAPGGLVRGEVLQNTAAADLSPTLLSLLGLAAPAGFAPFGQDLFLDEPAREVFSFGRVRLAADRGEASVVRGSDKLIYNFQMQSAQLYDLSADPAERHNLAEAQPEVAASLARALVAELEKSGLKAR